MGITKVGTKEAEGFDEDLDNSEYHDVAEEPTRRDELDNTVEPQRLSDFQGGYGSSSLKECIELLNTLPLLHSTLGSVRNPPSLHSDRYSYTL